MSTAGACGVSCRMACGLQLAASCLLFAQQLVSCGLYLRVVRLLRQPPRLEPTTTAPRLYATNNGDSTTPIAASSATAPAPAGVATEHGHGRGGENDVGGGCELKHVHAMAHVHATAPTHSQYERAVAASKGGACCDSVQCTGVATDVWFSD